MKDYPRPSVTVDLVIFTIAVNDLQVLLIRRDGEPFKGHWALPGGFVGIDESLEDAAARELQVDAVLDGNYQRVGDRVRVTARLTQAADGAALTAAVSASVNADPEKASSISPIDARWLRHSGALASLSRLSGSYRAHCFTVRFLHLLGSQAGGRSRPPHPEGRDRPQAFLGRLAPYFERDCLRSLTPCRSSEPRTMW